MVLVMSGNYKKFDANLIRLGDTNSACNMKKLAQSYRERIKLSLWERITLIYIYLEIRKAAKQGRYSISFKTESVQLCYALEQKGYEVYPILSRNDENKIISWN